MPQEAIDFYKQPVMAERNITIDRFPVGTGAYRMESLISHKEIVLVKNENFRVDRYPSIGEPNDRAAGLLDDAWEILPLYQSCLQIRKGIYSRWNKFLQGYYDNSGIPSDTFDRVVAFDNTGDPAASEVLKSKHIILRRMWHQRPVISPLICLTTPWVGIHQKNKTPSSDLNSTRL